MKPQQQKNTPPATGRLETTESNFQSWDGTPLFYRGWLPDGGFDRAVVLFHGGHEHSGRFQEMVDQLAFDGCALFAWDARGHGCSPGQRGDADHFHDYVKDADAFIRHLEVQHGIVPSAMAVIGHSVGSVIAATWVNDYAPPIRALVLGSPAFRIKLYIPGAVTGLKILERIRPSAHVNSYVRPAMLTHDEQEARERQSDPLISPRISVRVLNSLRDTAERIVANAGGIRVPTLIFSAGSDRVVDIGAHRLFFDNLGSDTKRLRHLPGFYHEIFHERGRHQPIEEARHFILSQFEVDNSPLTRIGLPPRNLARYQQLQTPLSRTSLAYWRYRLTALAIRSVGRLSNGVDLGWKSGFDSGRTLDYVYANRPTGVGPIGRLIDRNYLNSAGWAGIRTRRLHLERHLERAIETIQGDGSAAHIVDVAGGPGRYLIEVVRRCDDPQVTAVCRDMDLAGLEEGRAIAHACNVTTVLHEQGDAFDPDAIASLTPRPNIVIVSGLYELFEDNALVMRSLRAIYQRLAPGGYLIYTNQPHHPQLELIARTLINRNGMPWVMRLRPQLEMNDMVRQAGFEPLSMDIDRDGIFSVTTAQKEA